VAILETTKLTELCSTSDSNHLQVDVRALKRSHRSNFKFRNHKREWGE